MTNEKTIEILKEIKADPKAKEMFAGMETPKSLDEMISAYVQVAEKLGYNITAEDIREAVEQGEAKRKAKTEKVVSDMEALEDDDLEGIAGGFYTIVFKGEDKEYTSSTHERRHEKVYNKCRSDYVDTDCWNSDACSAVVHFYYDCSGEYFENGAEYDCILSQFWCDGQW